MTKQEFMNLVIKNYPDFSISFINRNGDQCYSFRGLENSTFKVEWISNINEDINEENVRIRLYQYDNQILTQNYFWFYFDMETHFFSGNYYTKDISYVESFYHKLFDLGVIVRSNTWHNATTNKINTMYRSWTINKIIND